MQVWPQIHIPSVWLRCSFVTTEGFCVFTGYGFVDFDSPAAAQKAVASLKANGVQAQMAKVRLVFRSSWFLLLSYFSIAVSWTENWSLQQFGLYLLVRENKKPHDSFSLEESGWFISLFLCIYLLIFLVIILSLVISEHLWSALCYLKKGCVCVCLCVWYLCVSRTFTSK